MSKFKIGDRVSFLYFGDKKRGTILAHWPIDEVDDKNGLWRVTLDNSELSVVCVAEKNMRKLKPRKPRREFWIVVETKYPGESFRTFPTEEDVFDYIKNDTDVFGWEIVQVREVIKWTLNK